MKENLFSISKKGFNSTPGSWHWTEPYKLLVLVSFPLREQILISIREITVLRLLGTPEARLTILLTYQQSEQCTQVVTVYNIYLVPGQEN